MIILNLIFFIILLGAVCRLISFIPMPPPFPTVIQGIFIISIVILAVLSVLFGLTLLDVSVPRLV